MIYLFVFLMAFFKACMDAFENENFFESIFKHWNQRFWYKRESWKHAKRLFGYKFDAWHIANSLYVICFALAVAYTVIWPLKSSWWIVLLNICVLWNATFIFFYHGVFKIK